jgi:hypothetical protein
VHLKMEKTLGTYRTGVVLTILAICAGSASADDSGFFGRLFRMGGNGSGQSQSAPVQSAAPASGSGLTGTGSVPGQSGFAGQGPISTPPVGASGPAGRVSPRPRVTRPITTADPLVTRMSLGRSNDGSQFGMFLQVFADGTVIDSEGVHHLRAADLKPIADTVASSELFRGRTHCGSPATDFVDYVHMIVYERRLGRLTASSFSYSGNPQGCEHAVRHLNTLLDNVQAKISGQPAAGTAGAGAAAARLPVGTISGTVPAESRSGLGASVPASSPRSNGQPAPPAVNPGGPVPTGPIIPLTPVDQSH